MSVRTAVGTVRSAICAAYAAQNAFAAPVVAKDTTLASLIAATSRLQLRNRWLLASTAWLSVIACDKLVSPSSSYYDIRIAKALLEAPHKPELPAPRFLGILIRLWRSKL